MQNFGMSMLWSWIVYLIVTIIGTGQTLFNIVVLPMKFIASCLMRRLIPKIISVMQTSKKPWRIEEYFTVILHFKWQ